jgi:nucleoside-diphosphate-sugar epimerase
MHANEPATPAPTALILGCGYLGRALARLLHARGQDVCGSVRSPQSAFDLPSLHVRPLILDVTQIVTLAALRPLLQAPAIDVYYLVPPGRETPHHSPRSVLIDGLQNVLRMLPAHKIHAAVMASSTAVYGQATGETISADTPPTPNDARGQLLLDSEKIFLAHGPQFRVCRLAGLYGPRRIIGLDAIRSGSPIAGNPAALLNLIHVDDAASLLLAINHAPQAAPIELGSDGRPTQRIEYYRELARRIGAPEPAVLDERASAQLGLNLDRLRRSSSKSCDNTPTRTRTGWAPQFPDFRSGLDACLPVPAN